MATQEDNRTNPSERTPRNEDIEDSSRDKVRLKPDEGFIDLPDVRDIPGQEHVHVPPLGEMSDTTISSDDEEGIGVFEDDEEDETLIMSGTEDDIPREDKLVLENLDSIDSIDEDDENLIDALPDNEDDDGEELNEKVDTSGDELDVPGSELDDPDEEIGEEDEENNQYSLGGEG